MDERGWLAQRFDTHRAHMQAVAARLLGSATEADDAVQEAWLRVSRAEQRRRGEPGGLAHDGGLVGVPEYARPTAITPRRAAGSARASGMDGEDRERGRLRWASGNEIDCSPGAGRHMDDVTGMVPATDLDTLVDDLRGIIAQGRGRAAAAVNAEIVRTYWQSASASCARSRGDALGLRGRRPRALGTILSREFGRGFAERSLQNMRQFYLAYPNASALRTELGWTHYRTLMRLPDEQRAFYEQVAAAGRWSSRELDKQINSMLYERTALSRKPDALLAALPRGETALAPTPTRSRIPTSWIFSAWRTPSPRRIWRPRCPPDGAVPGRAGHRLLLRRPPAAHHHRRRGLLHRSGVLAPHLKCQVLHRPEDRRPLARRHRADAALPQLGAQVRHAPRARTTRSA